MKYLIIFLISLSTAFAQTQINGARIKDGTLPPEKFTESVGRPVNAGALTAPYELTFDEVQKSYTLSVTEDIALTVAGSGNVTNSRIYITAVGDGSHSLSYPSDWKLKSGAYNASATNEIEINYRGSYTTIEIITLDPVIIPVLTDAAMTAADDVTLNFDNAVTITTAGWSVTASGGAATISSVVSGSGTTTIVFDLSRNITAGEEMSISYNPATGNTVSSTGNEIALISNFFVDTGEEEVPSNSITVDDSGGKDYTTIQAASDAAQVGQTVLIYSGTYRETVVAKTGVNYQAATGETPIISGLDEAGNTGWTVHSGNIYKKTITLPQATYTESLTSNTTILNNQVFDEGVMLFEARWPNIDDPSDLMTLNSFRHRSQATNGFAYTSIADTGLPNSSSFSLTGATLVCHGWFRPHIRSITSHSGTTIGFSNISSNDSDGQKYRQWYYVTKKLGLLDVAEEWHYESGILYVWQAGGGSPTNIEYKARNWGFDVRGKDDITITGLTFKGCDPVNGDASTDRVVVDNIRATYMNHDVRYPDSFPGYGNAVTSATTSGMPEMGSKLLGINNVVKNSEFRWSASSVIWVGPSGLIENNKFEDISYDGAWGAPASFYGLSDDVVITRNTFARTGRSGVDMGYSYTGNTQPQNANIRVSYNDFSGWCSLNVDGGAIYAWGFRDLTGGRYDHNWFHDDGVIVDPTGRKLDGGQRAVYFDQGTGPVTVDHNVFWNNFDANSPSDMQDTQDIYSQMEFTGGDGYHRNSGGNKFYNNAIMSRYAHHGYATYETKGTKDVFQNNEFHKIINLRWGLQGAGYGPLEDHNFFSEQSTNQSTAALGTGSVENVDFDIYGEDNGNANFFLETGDGGLFFRLHASSPGRNAGVVIPGITDDDDSTPDVGPYKFADNDDPWIPGYNAEAVDDEVYIQDNNLTFTSYSTTPTVQSSSTYKGGTSSFFGAPAVGQTITVTFTGTGFEWFAEKYNHSAIVSVTVDGVQRDCDAGTGGTQNCDLYVNSTTNNSTSIITVTGLSAGQHTAVFEVEDKNASSSNHFVVHDALRIIE